MKIKKASLIVLIVAIALVVGAVTAFAPSAINDENLLHEDDEWKILRVSTPDLRPIVDAAKSTEFSFEGTVFRYGEQDYDITLRSQSINSILTAVPVGNKIVIECHVGPKNGIYCIFNTVSRSFEKDIEGHNLIWHSDDIATAVYAFWSEIHTYNGSMIKKYNLEENELIYGLEYAESNTKLKVTIVCDDGTERTDIIDLSSFYIP